MVQLRPREDKTFLAPRQRTGELFDRCDTVNSYVILIVSMKMRRMVRPACLDEHADHNPKKSAKLRQGKFL